MVFNPDGNDVFAFCPATMWFFGNVATEMMFQEGNWLDGNAQSKGDIIKRVSVWSNNHLRETMPEVVETYNLPPPSFAAKAMEEWKKNESNSLFDLHIGLIVQASSELLSGLVEGVGEQNVHEVNQWFNLMKSVTESCLFNSASQTLRIKLTKVCKKFTSLTDPTSLCDGPEHPFFHHKLLFLRVALMVCFYTKTNGIIARPVTEDSGRIEREAPLGRIPHCINNTLSIGVSEMVSWEIKSGILVSKMLHADEHGMHRMGDNVSLVWINLPYQSMWSSSQKGKACLPSVTATHQAVLFDLGRVLNSRLRCMSSITLWEKNQFDTFNELVAKTRQVHTRTDKSIISSEKGRRSYYRKYQVTKGPIDPTAFARTTCVLGKHSFSNRFQRSQEKSSISKIPTSSIFDFPNEMIVVRTREAKSSRKRKHVSC